MNKCAIFLIFATKCVEGLKELNIYCINVGYVSAEQRKRKPSQKSGLLTQGCSDPSPEH